MVQAEQIKDAPGTSARRPGLLSPGNPPLPTGANIAAVAKAPIERVAAFAAHRGWRNLKLLSAADNSFKRDYRGEDEEGQQVPILTVFHMGADRVIRLSWASELLFMPTEPGQDPRHVGTVEPMWTLLDLTPGGRPEANEQIEYECCRTEVPANTQQP